SREQVCAALLVPVGVGPLPLPERALPVIVEIGVKADETVLELRLFLFQGGGLALERLLAGGPPRRAAPPATRLPSRPSTAPSASRSPSSSSALGASEPAEPSSASDSQPSE